MYALEYSTNDNHDYGLWLTPGILCNIENLIKVAQSQNGFSLQKEGDQWLMTYLRKIYKLRILKCLTFDEKRFIFNSPKSHVPHEFSISCAAYSLDKNELIAVHNDHILLANNMMNLFPNRNWLIKNFIYHSPWNLNIKDELCTTL